MKNTFYNDALLDNIKVQALNTNNNTYHKDYLILTWCRMDFCCWNSSRADAHVKTIWKLIIMGEASHKCTNEMF